MNQEEFYLNQLGQHSCVKLPSKDKNYLKLNNYLSEFGTEIEKAEARSNLGITPLLEQLKALIDAKVIQVNAAAWDLEPVEGNTENVLSSDALYNTLLKYCKKDDVQEWYNRFIEESKVHIDEELDETSTNPVQNRKIAVALNAFYDTVLEKFNENTARLNEDKQELIDLINSSLESKASTEDLTNYYNKTHVDAIQEQLETSDQNIQQELNQLREDIPGMIGGITYKPIDNDNIEQLISEVYGN